ncbi:hypothetical protein ABLN87_10095 [Ruegeria sp. SCPT10]|uniref:hypothetical protein n=1 Tax=Ruegeria sp. SCP10 TaxID=3141377 RepID=UPI003338E054
MEPLVSFFNINNLQFPGEAALRMLWVSLLSNSMGTVVGKICGWSRYESKLAAKLMLAPVLAIFRSGPLNVHLVLFF